MRVELFNGESDLITINRKDVFFVGELWTDGEDIDFKGNFFVDDEDGNKHPTELIASLGRIFFITFFAIIKVYKLSF